MRRFLLILTALLLTQVSCDFDEQMLVKLSAQIKQNLFKNLRSRINEVRDLQSLQNSLIEVRNIDCLNKVKIEKVEGSKEFKELLELATNVKTNLEIFSLAEKFDLMVTESLEIEFFCVFHVCV